MKKQYLGVAVAMVLSSAALAEGYDVELRGGLDSFDPEYGDSVELYRAGGTFYFNTVDSEGGPLAEAAFLNRASNMSAAFTYADNNGTDITSTNLGVEVFLPNSILYGAFNYSMVDVAGEDDDSWNARLGITPIDGLLLTTTKTQDVDYDPNIQAKYVMELAGGQALNLHGAINFADSTTFYTAGMDYYLTAQTSLGFEYSDATDRASDVFETYTVRGKHFFNETVYLAAHYTNTEFVDTVGVDVGVRF